ncbi:uncharacterized protein EDB91DRAFT_1090438 [Suillus paluster]|uniref:uncharacterized protein n=1 Tax=Suillus paluster TaxID=48578 RepID=UPI001B87A423|nr:uncharacterized protein EDB91DRAFT_1090438 [Suillus paluster]KAG1717954.1 hypothetical protein EDB91DRAFT_1090438 [Suillus paluster]
MTTVPVPAKPVSKETAVLPIPLGLFPHGVGHSLGMDVHDVPSASKPVNNTTIPQRQRRTPQFYTYLRLRLPLAEGMVVTIELVIYFHEHLLEVIEESDEYAVSASKIQMGARNLTKVRSDMEWLKVSRDSMLLLGDSDFRDDSNIVHATHHSESCFFDSSMRQDGFEPFIQYGTGSMDDSVS